MLERPGGLSLLFSTKLGSRLDARVEAMACSGPVVCQKGSKIPEQHLVKVRKKCRAGAPKAEKEGGGMREGEEG